MKCRICKFRETGKTSVICENCGNDYYYIVEDWKWDNGKIVYYEEKVPAKFYPSNWKISGMKLFNS